MMLRMRWVRHAARMGNRRDAYRVTGEGGRPNGKKPLGKPRSRW